MHSSVNRGISSASYSRSVSQYVSNSDDFSDHDLFRRIEYLKKETRVLKLENTMLESVIKRVDANLLNGIQQAIEHAYKYKTGSNINLGQNTQSRLFTETPPSKLLTSSRSRLLNSSSRILQSTSKILSTPSRALLGTSKISKMTASSLKISSTNTQIFGPGTKINLHERSELIATQIELHTAKVDRFKAKCARKRALLKAQIEELEVRVKNIEKATENFDKEVIIEGWDKIARRIPAEPWIKYMTDWLKLCDKEIAKIRLRTSTLRMLNIQLKSKIKVKAELREKLRPVDFDKLEIENKISLERIDTQLGQLGEVKKLTGDANLNLVIHKNLMKDQNDYLVSVKNKIQAKRILTKQTHDEADKISEQVDGLVEKLDKVKKVRLQYEVPDIMEYVQMKSDMTDLRRNLKSLEHTYHIQQIALKALNMKLHSMFFESTAYE